MVEIFGRHRRVFLITGIVLCILAIVFTISPSAAPNFIERAAAGIITPMQSGASTAISWVRGNFNAMANNRQMVNDIRLLQEEIEILRMENYRLQLAGEENAQLSALLYMNQRYESLPTMGARVIGTNPNDWYSRFFIDRGTNDGIKTNMAVIGDGGLLGVVRQVHPGRSQIVSIVDSEFSVAVMSARTGDIGIASGDIRLMQQGLLRMDRIEAAVQIMPGDEIRTSTHSSIFPSGILVGTVESIHPNPDGHTRHAIIKPAASLDNLEMVLVVTEVFGEGLRDAVVGE